MVQIWHCRTSSPKVEASSTEPEVKAEKPSEADIIKRRTAALRLELRPVLRKLQDFEIEAMALLEKPSTERYARHTWLLQYTTLMITTHFR